MKKNALLEIYLERVPLNPCLISNKPWQINNILKVYSEHVHVYEGW